MRPVPNEARAIVGVGEAGADRWQQDRVRVTFLRKSAQIRTAASRSRRSCRRRADRSARARTGTSVAERLVSSAHSCATVVPGSSRQSQSTLARPGRTLSASEPCMPRGGDRGAESRGAISCSSAGCRANARSSAPSSSRGVADRIRRAARASPASPAATCGTGDRRQADRSALRAPGTAYATS